MAFGRYLEVRIHDLGKDELTQYIDYHMDVTVQRSILSEMNSAKITIYNQTAKAQDSIQILSEVQILAGYTDTSIETIFSGVIFQVKYSKRGVDRITEIDCITTTRSVTYPSESTYTPRNLLLKAASYPAGYGYDKMLKELCDYANMTFIYSPLQNEDGTNAYNNKIAFSGTGSLEALVKKIGVELKKIGFAVFIDNNECILYSTSGTTPLNTVIMTPNDGIIYVEKLKTQMKSVTTTLANNTGTATQSGMLDKILKTSKELQDLIQAWYKKVLSASSAASRLNQGMAGARPEYQKVVQKSRELIPLVTAFDQTLGIQAQAIDSKISIVNAGYESMTGWNGMAPTSPLQGNPALRVVTVSQSGNSSETHFSSGAPATTIVEYMTLTLGLLSVLDTEAKRMYERKQNILKDKASQEAARISQCIETLTGIQNRISGLLQQFLDDQSTMRQNGIQTGNFTLNEGSAIQNDPLPTIWKPWITNMRGYSQIYIDFLPGITQTWLNDTINQGIADLGYLIEYPTWSFAIYTPFTQGSSVGRAVEHMDHVQNKKYDETKLNRAIKLMRDLLLKITEAIKLLSKAVGKPNRSGGGTVTTLEQPSRIFYKVEALMHPFVRPNGIFSIPFQVGGRWEELSEDYNPTEANWQPLALLVEAVDFELSNWQDTFKMIVEGSLLSEYNVHGEAKIPIPTNKKR